MQLKELTFLLLLFLILKSILPHLLMLLKELLLIKATPTEAKENEGYFKGVIDAAGGSPEVAPKNDPDIRALFSESTNRHFNKGK